MLAWSAINVILLVMNPSRSQLAARLARRWMLASLAIVPCIVTALVVEALTAPADHAGRFVEIVRSYAVTFAGVSLFGALVAVGFYGILRNGVGLKPRDLRDISFREWSIVAASLVPLGAFWGYRHVFYDGGSGPAVGFLVIALNGLLMANSLTDQHGNAKTA